VARELAPGTNHAENASTALRGECPDADVSSKGARRVVFGARNADATIRFLASACLMDDVIRAGRPDPMGSRGRPGAVGADFRSVVLPRVNACGGATPPVPILEDWGTRRTAGGLGRREDPQCVL